MTMWMWAGIGTSLLGLVLAWVSVRGREPAVDLFLLGLFLAALGAVVILVAAIVSWLR